MRKVLVLLLIIGILASTCAVIEDFCKEYSAGEQADFAVDELTKDSIGNPAPCGGGSDGSGGTPG